MLAASNAGHEYPVLTLTLKGSLDVGSSSRLESEEIRLSLMGAMKLIHVGDSVNEVLELVSFREILAMTDTRRKKKGL